MKSILGYKPEVLESLMNKNARIANLDPDVVGTFTFSSIVWPISDKDCETLQGTNGSVHS